MPSSIAIKTKEIQVAEAVYHSMIAEYSLGSGITYGWAKTAMKMLCRK